MEYFATFYLHTVAARFSSTPAALTWHSRTVTLRPKVSPSPPRCSLEPQCAQSVGSVMKLLRQAVRP